MARSSLPPVGFRFELKFFESETQAPFIDSEGPDACFQEVSGMSVEFEVESVADGASPSVPKLPKKPVFPDLVLKRGLLLESKILSWIFTLLEDSQMEVTPLDVEVSLKNEEGQPLLNFRFYKAWPKKWGISDFNAMDSGLVIETLELSYEYFKPKFP